MVMLAIFLFINTLFIFTESITQFNTIDSQNYPTLHRHKRAPLSSSSITTLKTTSKTSTTTQDPIDVLAQQLEEVEKQRQEDKRKEAEEREREKKLREAEKKLREREQQMQQADVIKQREEAAAKQPGGSKNSSEPVGTNGGQNKPTEPAIDKQSDEMRQESATQLLTQKYLKGTKNNDTLISEILNQCEVENCFNKVIKQAVERILQKTKVTSLIKTERKLNSSVEESTSIYKFVSDKISKKDYTAWTDLAVRVKEIMSMKVSANVTAELKRIRDSKIPRSIKNLVFSTKICIKNTKYNEYLYAVGSRELWFDNNRRHVFTRLGGARNGTGESGEFFWRVESIAGNNEFSIINHKYNEYLFVDSAKWDDRNRFAFTWTDDKPVTQNVWKITPDSEGRYFEVKNTKNNEYLFADYDRIFEGTMRCVFTYTDGSNSIEGMWDFINCSSEK
ncbi:MAP7 domain-containing protein 2-like [Planococcus citri]|uniref:MAP7 domain-containing protein 2-like n=1 Tax=Planococcus citri TaxID=170843 RepID=UPI0031F8A374